METAIARHQRSRSRASATLVVLYVCVSAAMCWWVIGVDRAASADDGTTWWLAVMVVALDVFLLASWRAISGTLLDFYGIFLLSTQLFLTGQLWLVAIGALAPSDLLSGQFDPQEILVTLVALMTGLLCFHAGAVVSRIARQPVHRRPGATPSPRRVRQMGAFLLGLSSLPYVYIGARTVQAFASIGYQGLTLVVIPEGDVALSLLVHISLMFPAGALFLLAGSRDSRPGRIIAALAMGIIVSTSLAVGDRSSAFPPLIAFLWLWHHAIRRLPVASLWIGLLLFVALSSLIVALRTGNSVQGAVEAGLVGTGSIKQVLMEFGGSLQSVAHTLELVPTRRPFDLGMGYLYSLAGVLPGVPGDPHGNPAEWYTREVAPQIAAVGGGLGYSFVAEAYLAFGYVGLTLLMALMGWLVGCFSRFGAASRTPAAFALVAVVLAYSLRIPRGMVEDVVRPGVWYGLVPYVLLHSHFTRQRLAGQPPLSSCGKM